MSNLQKPITSFFFIFLVKGSIIISHLQVMLFSLISSVPIFYLGLGSGKAWLLLSCSYSVLPYLALLHYFSPISRPFHRPVIDCFHLCFTTGRWDDLGTGHHYVTIASLCNVALSSIASHSKGSEEEEEENGEKKKVPKPGDVVNLVSHCTQTDLTV